MKILYCLIFLLLSASGFSQSPLNWYWAQISIGSSANCTGVAADSSGNVFVTGYFGGSAIVFGAYTLINLSEGNIFFIVKYSPAGNVLWAKAPEGGNEIYSYSVATDAGGNAYITGGYYGGFILGNYALPNTPNNDLNSFVAKYDGAGNVLWASASTAPPGNNNNYGYSIATDRNGNSYSTGNFSGDSVSFGGYTLYNNNADAYSLYVVKYNSAGNALWAKSTSGNDVAYGIAVDGNNNAYITGYYSADSVSFGNNTIYHNYNFGNGNYFIARYDSSGNVLWAEGASEGNAFCIGYDLATDRQNNIYVTGFLSGTYNFGGPVTISSLAGSGNLSAFIVKYNDSGNAIWGKASGGGVAAEGVAIAIDAANNVYATGMGGSASFDSVAMNYSGFSVCPIYIFTFDSSGNVLCASGLNNASCYIAPGPRGQKLSLCTDKSGKAYIASDFDGNNAWNLVVGSDTLFSGSEANVFVAKFICPDCAIDDTFSYQLSPFVLCRGDSANLNFNSYAGLSISPSNQVNWSDSLHAVLKPDSTTTYIINGYLPCGMAHSQSFTLPVVNGTAAIISANTDTICSGDSAQICATSNFSSYTWSPAIGGTASQCIETGNPGAYYLIASDNNGCTAQSNTISVTVLQTATPTINTSADSICPNDSAKLCAQQGFASYVWSSPFGGQGPCIEVRSAGNYNVTVSDNFNCTAQSNAISIAVRLAPIAFIKTSTDTICPGDSTQICSALNDSLYVWNTGSITKCIEAKNAGDYYVSVTDNNGCTVESNHVGIIALPTPQVSISRIGDTLIANNAITSQWYLNNEPINGAIQNTYIAQTKGIYTVSVTDSDGCTAYSSAIVYTGIVDINENDNIFIYPNPTSGKLYGTLGYTQKGNIQILAIDGREVMPPVAIQQNRFELDLSNLAAGLYFWVLQNEDERVVRKFVKE